MSALKQKGPLRNLFRVKKNMSESALRLAALKDALVYIFPSELLPIINNYVKASVHEWITSAHKFYSVTKNRIEVQTDFEGCAYGYAESKFDFEEGPLKWSIECQVGESVFMRGSDIEVGLVAVEAYETKVAHFWRNAFVLTPNVGYPLATYSSLASGRAQLIIEAKASAGQFITTTTFTDFEGKVHTETNSHFTGRHSCRAYVRLMGNASVELIDC